MPWRSPTPVGGAAERERWAALKRKAAAKQYRALTNTPACIYNVITYLSPKDATMNTVIKTRIVKIGNSQGIRIPKVLVDQLGLASDIEMEVQDGQLVIRSARPPRLGWDNQFRQMAERGDDHLLDAVPPSLSNWDQEEWSWE
jgi:antitoxin MazE